MTPEGSYDDAVADIRDEYNRRAVAAQCRGMYSFDNAAHAFQVFEREQAILRSLTTHLAVPLGDAVVLDVGCSSGLSLALLAVYGSRADRLHGVDVMQSRIEAGRAAFPAFDLRVSDGASIEYEDATFDLVQQITVLSSIPDVDLRAHLAKEMVRVLKPGGILLSYDVAAVGVLPRAINRALTRFAKRPDRITTDVPPTEVVVLRNPASLEPDHLKELFAGTTQVELKRLSLYRPLAERLAGRHVLLAAASALKPLATTWLYVARKSAQ